MGLITSGLWCISSHLIALTGTPGPALGAERYLQLMHVDKKSEGGEIRFVVIDRLGSARMQGAPEAMVREVLAAHCSASAS